jgi:DNA-binding transcriptional MerR regulator
VLKIGEFSALTRVSVKTLRYYDEVGLLKPVRVDPESGYRYYSASQLPRLHRIPALKDLGFPLDHITKAIEEGVTSETLRGMLMLRRADQEGRVQDEMERLARLQARLRLIELEGTGVGGVVLKNLPSQWIASLRGLISAHREVGGLFGKLFAALGPGLEGTAVALWHDQEYKEQGLDVEAGVYLKAMAAVSEPLTIRALPATTVASIVHHGAFNRISEAYQAVLQWIEANGYRQTGPVREVFLRVAAPVSRGDESNVTEIQVPVEKG